MTSLVLAVDPGLSGSLVLLDRQRKCVGYLLTPTIKVGSRNRVNATAIASWLRPYLPSLEHAFIEQVGAMPGQGVTSMFTFGHATGCIEGIVASSGIPYTPVPPQVWKKHSGFIGQDKDAPRSRAVQLYPELRVLDLKEKGQAIADALFIGLYGLSTLPNTA